MAIAKNPTRTSPHSSAEKQAEAFISAASEAPPTDSDRKPTMVRIPGDIRERIDAGARRLGLSRAAFLVQSAVEKLDRMEAPARNSRNDY